MKRIAMLEAPPPSNRRDTQPAPRRIRRRRLVRREARTLPETPAASEAPAPARPRLSVISFSTADVVDRPVQRIEEAIGLVRSGAVTWIDVAGLGDSSMLARLGERFGLHPLAIEDALNVPQRSKVEHYDTHFFIVLRMIRGGAEVEEEQVSIFFGADWVLTVQERPDGDVFDPVREAIRHRRGRVRGAGADYLAYLLLDAVVDGYFPVLDAVTERLETLQDDAIAEPMEGTLVGIQRLRRDVVVLRRAVWPVREEIGVLQRDESGLIARETKVFLRDAYDHAVQALEMVEVLREGAASVMEVYLSAQNQRLNQVMKVLTVIATLFIPLTFIASIYGMNFEIMPELKWRYGYLWALGLMGATLVALAAYFKRKGWW